MNDVYVCDGTAATCWRLDARLESIMRPTPLEKLLGARINLKICGRWLGTGHAQLVPPNARLSWPSTDTESEPSESY